MDYSFLSPVQERLVDELDLLHSQTIGKKLRIHSTTFEPSLEGVKIAIIGVLESRNSVDYIGEEFQFTEIRKAFYKLFQETGCMRLRISVIFKEVKRSKTLILH